MFVFQIDVVLSDMAPNTSGNKKHDSERIFMLCQSALRFALQNSRIGASFLCKVSYNLIFLMIIH